MTEKTESNGRKETVTIREKVLSDGTSFVVISRIQIFYYFLKRQTIGKSLKYTFCFNFHNRTIQI